MYVIAEHVWKFRVTYEFLNRRIAHQRALESEDQNIHILSVPHLDSTTGCTPKLTSSIFVKEAIFNVRSIRLWCIRRNSRTIQLRRRRLRILHTFHQVGYILSIMCTLIIFLNAEIAPAEKSDILLGYCEIFLKFSPPLTDTTRFENLGAHCSERTRRKCILQEYVWKPEKDFYCD